MITFLRKLNSALPNKKLFVENPMPLEAELDTPAANRTFQVTISVNDGEATEILQGKFIADKCLIDLKSYLHAFVRASLPNFVLGFADGMKAKFNLTYDVLDETGTSVYNEVDVTDYFCYLGGVYVEQYPTQTISPLAHTQLTSKTVSIAKILLEHLYIDANASDLHISSTVYQRVGPNITNTEDLTATARPAIYPLSRLLTPMPTDAWRVVIVVNSNAISQTITYNIDNKERRYERDFIFENTLGGFDLITLTGQRKKMTETERSTAMKDLQYTYQKNSSEKNTFKTKQATGYKQETGYMSKAMLDYLARELMTSKQVFELKGGELVAITLVTTKFDYDEDSITPQSVSIEYMLGLS